MTTFTLHTQGSTASESQIALNNLTEVWHIAHFWVCYGRCAMPGFPMGYSEGLSW